MSINFNNIYLYKNKKEYSMTSQNSIDNLNKQDDIVKIISKYIPLEKVGDNFKGCCPFHGGNIPSFVVNPGKQIYHCFGCGAGGDSVNFIEEYKKLLHN
jgi:DNA primase